MKNKIKNILEEHKLVLSNIIDEHEDTIAEICESVIKAIHNGNSIYFFGNGGSAADSLHLAAEFTGKFKFDRKPLRASALTTNMSAITAVSNDYDFESVFSRQVDAFVSKGDIVFGISTSGKSKNVIEGIKKANEKGAVTIAFTGIEKQGLSELAQYSINIPSSNTARIQELHILVGHAICEIVEEDIFGKKTKD
ncbi:SIS domain-containing protein [Candidatus Woesearchaeota archaeon]|nr:SIS domain-containing protein [Candidatus Woesearchaeota archaeon]